MDNQLPWDSDFWVEVLSDQLESVFGRLLKPTLFAPDACIPALMGSEDFQLAVHVLCNGSQSGLQAVVNARRAQAFVFAGVLSKVTWPLAEALCISVPRRI